MAPPPPSPNHSTASWRWGCTSISPQPLRTWWSCSQPEPEPGSANVFLLISATTRPRLKVSSNILSVIILQDEKSTRHLPVLTMSFNGISISKEVNRTMVLGLSLWATVFLDITTNHFVSFSNPSPTSAVCTFCQVHRKPNLLPRPSYQLWDYFSRTLRCRERENHRLIQLPPEHEETTTALPWKTPFSSSLWHWIFFS